MQTRQGIFMTDDSRSFFLFFGDIDEGRITAEAAEENWIQYFVRGKERDKKNDDRRSHVVKREVPIIGNLYLMIYTCYFSLIYFEFLSSKINISEGKYILQFFGYIFHNNKPPLFTLSLFLDGLLFSPLRIPLRLNANLTSLAYF